MARTKVTETPKPEDTAPVALLRVEERNERVDITPEQKVERMKVAAGMMHEANALRDEAADLAERAKNKKKSSEAKREEAERVLFDADTGTMLKPYPVIVERHPVRPAEMMVWRVADGLTAAELLELEPVEQPRTEEEHIAAREAQGCTLLESRAMTPDELAVAQAEDHARANPPLPMDGLEAPASDASTTDEPGPESNGDLDEDGDAHAQGDDDDLDGDQGDDGEEDDGEEESDTDGDDSNGDEDDKPAQAVAQAAAPARKGKPASPNVIARVRIALNGLTGGATYNMAELAERTGHHADDIKPAIEQLIEEGFAVKSGKGRGTRYGLAPVPATTEPVAETGDAPAEL